MKAYIGPYPSRLTCNVHRRLMKRRYGYHWPEQQTKLETFLERLEDGLQAIYDRTINLWLDKRDQTVLVKIDPHDAINANVTLAHIIVPLLKQLKQNQQGAPFVDVEDVPDHLMPKHPIKKLGDVDDTHFERWDYVLDEMIFAFEKKLEEDSWKDEFYVWEECEDATLGYKLVSCDKEGIYKMQKRIQN